MEEIKQRSKTEQHIKVQKNQALQRELIGQIVPHNGHQIWEINNNTLSIQLATYVPVKTFVLFSKNPKTHTNEILVKDNCSYVSAMNKKSAMKKYLQDKDGSKEVLKEPITLNIYE
jgi:hypothetical protein